MKIYYRNINERVFQQLLAKAPKSYTLSLGTNSNLQSTVQVDNDSDSALPKKTSHSAVSSCLLGS